MMSLTGPEGTKFLESMAAGVSSSALTHLARSLPPQALPFPAQLLPARGAESAGPPNVALAAGVSPTALPAMEASQSLPSFPTAASCSPPAEEVGRPDPSRPPPSKALAPYSRETAAEPVRKLGAAEPAAEPPGIGAVIKGGLWRSSRPAAEPPGIGAKLAAKGAELELPVADQLALRAQAAKIAKIALAVAKERRTIDAAPEPLPVPEPLPAPASVSAGAEASATRAEVEVKVNAEDISEEVMAIRKDWLLRQDQAKRGNLPKISFAEWYRQLPVKDQRILTPNLSEEEKEEIRANSTGFMEVVTRSSAALKEKGEGEKPTGDVAQRSQQDVPKTALAPGRLANQFGALAAVSPEDTPLTDKEVRKQDKKERREERRLQEHERQLPSSVSQQERLQEHERAAAEAREAPTRKVGAPKVADAENDLLEARLASKHSTATVGSGAHSKPHVHKKMTSKEIDAYTTPKALRRALLDRGIAQAVVEQFEEKPDELKRLRAHAKTLPGVCSEARSRGRIHVEGVQVDPVEAQEIERLSEFINNPSHSAKGAAYADTIQDVVNDVAQKASDVFSYVKGAVLGSTSGLAPPVVADNDNEDEHGAASAQANESSEEGKERQRKEQLKKLVRARAREARA